MADVLKKVPVREQEPKVRATNFEEVCYGYNKEEAMEEATRCLNCKNARCIQGCPVSINIPAFIAEIKEGNIEEAYKVIGQSSALPAICGRVCPQESQCESKCVRGIKGDAVSIGKLERFVADYALENDIKPEKPEKTNGHKVAVIGSGPSGLTCAGDLAKLGYEVTVFEALHELGGVLVYGIPEFRLPKQKVVKKEIEKVKELGVKFETNVVIGKSTTIDQLMEEEDFEAVFIGSGAGLPMFMGIPGETANGVFSANEYLTRSNLMKAFDVGGGNVAIDAARTALRLGAEVHIVYRRSEAELPARVEEVHHAKEEGVQFDLLTNPKGILVDENGWVKGMKVTLYTDGAARGNPDGPGGYGAVLQFVDAAGRLHEKELSAGYRKTTNNRMELMAAIVGLEALVKPCQVELYSDSKYLTDAFNQHWIQGWLKRGWKKSDKSPVKNKDLWTRLLAAMEPHQVNFHWVKGHDGHPENERCDRLATTAADGSNLLEDEITE